MRVRLYAYDAGDCDPKRCTVRRLAAFGLVKLAKLKHLRKSLLLFPTAEKALSPAVLSWLAAVGLRCLTALGVALKLLTSAVRSAVFCV